MTAAVNESSNIKQGVVTVLARPVLSAARPPTRPAAGPNARRQRYRQRQTLASKTILAHQAGQ